MHADDSTLTTRYALKITLIYLLIRGIPALVLFVVNVLPPESLMVILKDYDAWMYLYPVMPARLIDVPIGFQQALAVLPVLIVEILLVFLFSAWFLRRKPWVASSTNKSRWIMLTLVIVIWSLAIRHPFLVYIQTLVTDVVAARENDANWLDDLPFLLMKAHWTLTAVLYATTVLWAWLPTWLHFRFAKNPADAPANASDIDTVSSVASLPTPLQRATVFGSFLLGCVALHFALVQAVYMGLWPWAAERAGMYVSFDDLDGMGLPLALSQIVFATLICALAAYVYVRRPMVGTAPAQHRVVKPLLAGMGAYLLTCFLFLALVWLVLWVNPGLTNSFLRQLAYAPELGIALAIALNISALVLLCLMSDRFRQSPRLSSAVLAGLILFASVPSYVGWTLTASNMGIAGGTPGAAVTGELGDAHWRDMEQWCTGVVQTSQGTWLVGRRDESRETASYVPDGVPDLSALIIDERETGTERGFNLFGSRPVLTTLARLQDDGSFKITATIPEVACLVVSPESEDLFLFTGVKTPRSELTPARSQTAVFRSTDHGASWQWLESGFMPDVQDLAWNVRPTFGSELDVWAWGAEPPAEDDAKSAWGRPAPTPPRRAADGTEHRATALFYSANQGKTSTVIYSPEPLVVPMSYLQDTVGEPEAKFSNSRYLDQKRFVVQVDDRRAYVWVSERTWYHVGEKSERLMLTTRADLSRTEPDHEWTVTRVIRQPDMAIHHLSTSLDGQTYAIMHDADGEWLVHLDTLNGEWVERQKTPSLLPGWLAQDGMSTRYFWNNGDYQVVSQWGYTYVPRFLIPFSQERAEINTDAHFYTHDGGRNWKQLAIPGYLGVMGLSPHGSKLYWSKGNWYTNDEPRQWEYDLAK